MNILIAEDDAVSCHLLARILASWNHNVSIATDGQMAWDLLSRPDAPALAILDVMMPHMDGYEICRKVRGLSRTVDPYLILLSAMSAKDDVVHGIQSGANDYLTKPFHREELRARVEVGVRMLDLQRVLAERVTELEQALSQVTQLQGLLPICSYCKKVRDDHNYWQQVESYIADRTDVKFSHGICPACVERVTSELKAKRQELAGG